LLLSTAEPPKAKRGAPICDLTLQIRPRSTHAVCYNCACTRQGRDLMSDLLTAAALIERVDVMDDEELDRLQAAIDSRRRQLVGDEELLTAGASSSVVERRAYGSGVLQLEKRGESGPYWYFHHRKDGKQKTVYLGKTDAPEIKLAQIKGGIGG
jgi:hypothetical protein